MQYNIHLKYRECRVHHTETVSHEFCGHHCFHHVHVWKCGGDLHLFEARYLDHIYINSMREEPFWFPGVKKVRINKEI